MIWSSRIGKLGIVLVSIGAHGLAVSTLWSESGIQIEGGAETAVQARLGNSFADMAAGTLAPETPETLEDLSAPEMAEPVRPEATLEQTSPKQMTETTDQVMAEETLARTDVTPREPIAPAMPAEAIVPTTARAPAPVVTDPNRALQAIPAPVAPLKQITPLKPPMPSPQRAEPQATEPQPTLAATAPPPEALQALPEDGLQVSRRPRARPKRAEPHQQPAPRGNARQNAVAGSETGSEQATARQQSTSTGRSRAAGNAAVSNYPGQVMRCISRAGRPRGGSRGTAVVAFVVSSNGRIAQVSLARSSGNARLDRAALQTISRAGPCPAPPPGAQRSYQISIKGRG